MNVLSIENSFSRDAQRYIHGIVRSDGEKINVFNLYIGGCALSGHYRNTLVCKEEAEIKINKFHKRVLSKLLKNQKYSLHEIVNVV